MNIYWFQFSKIKRWGNGKDLVRCHRHSPMEMTAVSGCSRIWSPERWPYSPISWNIPRLQVMWEKKCAWVYRRVFGSFQFWWVVWQWFNLVNYNPWHLTIGLVDEWCSSPGRLNNFFNFSTKQSHNFSNLPAGRTLKCKILQPVTRPWCRVALAFKNK